MMFLIFLIVLAFGGFNGLDTAQIIGIGIIAAIISSNN